MITKKIFLTSAAAFGIVAFCSVANANIAADAESAGCNEPTIGASSGNTTLEAQWNPNENSITWYDGDTPITPTNEGAGECVYDTEMTLPENTLTKEGYTFDGWTVRRAAACRLSNVDINIGTTKDAQHVRWKPINESSNGGYTMDREFYGVENSSDLSNGEWAVTFSYGTVKGMSLCGRKSGNTKGYTWSNASSNWTGTEEELILTSAGDLQNCWCKATELNGVACPVEISRWVYVDWKQNETSCKNYCAYTCALSVMEYSGLRSAFFGDTAQ